MYIYEQALLHKILDMMTENCSFAIDASRFMVSFSLAILVRIVEAEYGLD